MDNTLYVGLSRQMTLQREMDVIANNIANTDTVGFKVESLLLREDPQQPPKPPGGASVPDTIVFVQDVGLARNFSQGPLKQTGATFDLGLLGDGFFQVQTANGPRFTRDGRFGLDAQGQLIDAAGDPVLSNGGAPIRLDPTKTPPSIAADGTVSQDATVVARIGVFQFASRSLLQKVGAGFYDAGGQTPTASTTTTKVQQGMIETSNVDAVQQMTRMITVSRAYEQVAGMIQQTGDTADQSIQRLGRVN